MLTEQQQQLLLQIITKLDEDAVTGGWPEQRCKWCNGKSSGYYYDQDFWHNSDCIVQLIAKLRETMHKNGQIGENEK